MKVTDPRSPRAGKRTSAQEGMRTGEDVGHWSPDRAPCLCGQHGLDTLTGNSLLRAHHQAQNSRWGRNMLIFKLYKTLADWPADGLVFPSPRYHAPLQIFWRRWLLCLVNWDFQDAFCHLTLTIWKRVVIKVSDINYNKMSHCKALKKWFGDRWGGSVG